MFASISIIVATCMAALGSLALGGSKGFGLSFSSAEDSPGNHTEKEPSPTSPDTINSSLIVKNQSSQFYYQYPGQDVWLRYVSDQTEYIRLNYSGPSASLKQFFVFDTQPNSYLTYSTNVTTSIDCFLVYQNREYYFKLSSLGAGGTYWTVEPESLPANPTLFETYVLHQTFDQNSSQGYHYQIEDYASLASLTPTTTSATYINHTNPSYFNGVDNDHFSYHDGFDDNGQSIPGWSDGRRAIEDTQCSEFSAIAFGEDKVDYRPLTASGDRAPSTFLYFRSSGTFISQTVVATCAHTFYTEFAANSQLGYLADGNLPKSKLFIPGMNSYSYTVSGHAEPFGVYDVTEAYVSVSLLLSIRAFGKYEVASSKYDWALCKTVPRNPNTVTPHSTMGITKFELSGDYFSFASFAGYGILALGNGASDNRYKFLQWATLDNRKVLYKTHYSGTYLGSTEITTSGGHSGGPLYYKNVILENGQLHYVCLLIGIASGFDTFPSINGLKYYHSASFFQTNGLFVNLANEVCL